MSKLLSTCAALLSAATLLAEPQGIWFTASLDGEQEVPPVTTSAKGWALIRANDATNAADIFVETAGFNGTAAHLHIAPAGSVGPVIVPLTGGPTRWTATNVVLTPSELGAVATAGTYLNVHSAANPSGEIRGQVVTPGASAFQATLDGGQEVPPNGSTAKGSALAILHQPDDVLTYAVQSSGLASVAAAHIHMAPAGSQGAVIHALRGSAGIYCGVTGKLTQAQLAALQASGLYFNIHTATFPGGEIRGQILPSGPQHALRASLDGGQEVPPVPTAALGSGCLRIRPDGFVDYLVTTQGLVNASAAHIHKAGRGVNGGVVFALTGGPTVWTGSSPTAMTAAQIADAVSESWYVNVHTVANPAGEIRGQVEIAVLPATFGAACPGSGGALAEIGATTFPCLGDRASP